MERKIRILYVSAEITPYASAGGLGEVGQSLPAALLDSGKAEIQRVMPLYQCIREKGFQLNYLMDFPVLMGAGFETCIVKTEPEGAGIPTYFIGNDRYYNRDQIYAYEDDGFRFYFFCRAVLELLKRVPFQPDIIHVNDWHTGFIPLMLKKKFPGIKTVFTIHNIAYQGFVPASVFSDELEEEQLRLLGYPEWLNFMKAGIEYADLVTTVSPGYKKEIRQPQSSFGMYKLLRNRHNAFVGILNGIAAAYDPRQAGGLAYPYDYKEPERKKLNRAELRMEYGLPEQDLPMVAMITRLEYAKGIDVLIKAVSYSDLSKFQLVILGSGNPYYQGILKNMAEGYAGKIIFESNYSAELAKKIYAAADIYLMPSLYEPCGLGQLYALRYGAVPIVNPVGGLRDTVICDSRNPARNTGFYMEEWSGEALAKAIALAVAAYHTPQWIQLIQNGMRYNSTWKKSVSKYIKQYERLLKEP